MKIVVSGGHFSPALAIIQELKEHVELLVIGRKYVFEGDRALSYEYMVCDRLGIPFKDITAARFQRAFSAHTIPSLFKFPIGTIQALYILRKFKPDVAVLFGGYISLPVAIASFLLRIPIVIHEQTQKAGLANKIISKFAAKICVSFESSREFFPQEKTVLTGNPIRKEIFAKAPPNSKAIYVTGGSSGSHFINTAIGEIVEKLLEKFTVIHQTGDSSFNDFDKLTKIRDSLPAPLQKKYILKKFIRPDEIGEIFGSAALVISRSGINTIFELLALGKMCLLIPLPHGQHGEQLENARLIEKVGIGEYIEQKDTTGEILLAKTLEMLQNEKKYNANVDSAKKYIVPDATERISRVIHSVYEKNVFSSQNKQAFSNKKK